MMKEEVFDDAFIRENIGLIRLLIALNREGKRGLATRRVCKQVFNSRSYGIEMLHKAEALGLIKRVGKEPPPPKEKGSSRGNWPVVRKNYITPKGVRMLKRLLL
jgi:hypothetical protein